MVYYLLLFGQLAISMVHYPFLLVHWLSLWYSTIFYWPTGYPNGTLPSPISPLAIPMIHYCLLLAHWISKWYTTSISLEHYYLLLAHWISQWYTTLFYWLACCVSLWYTTFFYWPTGYLYGLLPYHVGPLAISLVPS